MTETASHPSQPPQFQIRTTHECLDEWKWWEIGALHCFKITLKDSLMQRRKQELDTREAVDTTEPTDQAHTFTIGGIQPLWPAGVVPEDIVTSGVPPNTCWLQPRRDSRPTQMRDILQNNQLTLLRLMEVRKDDKRRRYCPRLRETSQLNAWVHWIRSRIRKGH